MDWYLAKSQDVHSSALEFDVNVPAAHLEQEEAPVEPEYSPGEQAVQEEERALLKYPFGQSVQFPTSLSA